MKNLQGSGKRVRFVRRLLGTGEVAAESRFCLPLQTFFRQTRDSLQGKLNQITGKLKPISILYQEPARRYQDSSESPPLLSASKWATILSTLHPSGGALFRIDVDHRHLLLSSMSACCCVGDAFPESEGVETPELGAWLTQLKSRR